MKGYTKRYWKWFATAVFTLTAVLLFLRNAREPDPGVHVSACRRGEIVERIPATGKIRPVREISLSSDISGEIVRICIGEGDSVRRGSRVLQIAQEDFLSAIRRSEAAVNSARARYRQEKAECERCRTDFLRKERLYSQEALSREELEAAETLLVIAENRMEAASSDIENAEAALKEARNDLRRTTVFSPIDGIVSALFVEEGERIVGTAQMNGTELLRIADFTRMEVQAFIHEKDILRITAGDTAVIDVEAHPDRRFLGRVTDIARSAGQTDSYTRQSSSYEVRIGMLDPTDAFFLPGMSASVEIETEKRKDAVLVPLEAVIVKEKTDFEDKDAGIAGEYVFLFDESTSTVRLNRIETGIQDLKYIEVVSGLSPDTDRIVVGPYQMITQVLKEGAKVRPVNKEQI